MKTDPTAAFAWARKAFDAKAPVGRALLAHYLSLGIGIEKNPLAAERLLTPMPDDTPLNAMILADLLAEIRSNQEARIETLYHAAEKGGILSATLKLAERRITQAAGNADKLNSVVNGLKPLVDQGNSTAGRWVYLAICAKTPPISESDQQTAIESLTKAAEQGDGHAQVTLAREYFQEQWLTGKLATKADPKQAFLWAETAMADSSLDSENAADAKQITAICLITGKGVKQDIKRGVEFMNQSVKAKTKNSLRMSTWWLTDGVKYVTPR